MSVAKEKLKKILRFISSLIHFILGHLISGETAENDKQQK